MHRTHYLRALIIALAATLLITACGGGGPAGPATPLAPSLTGFTPEAALRGASITISGANFGTSAGTVTVGGQAASVTDWSATSVTATVPETAANGWTDVSVTTAGGTATQAGLFVGVEYTGDTAGLQDFLHAQPRGTAILLGARAYDMTGLSTLIVNNVELFGRGSAETQLLPHPTGAMVLAADFGGLSGITDLTVSGGTFLVVPGSVSEDPTTVALNPLPTVVVRNAVMNVPDGFATGGSGPLTANLEVQGSDIDTGADGFDVIVTGNLVISGATIKADSATVVSVTGYTEVTDLTVVANDVQIGGQAGLSVQDSNITAEDGDIDILGNVVATEVPGFPGGPVTVTGSILEARDADLTDGIYLGTVSITTHGAPIELTDNPRIRDQGDLEIYTDYNDFAQGSITVARNPDIHVGVFIADDPLNARPGYMYVGGGSTVLPSTVRFVSNEFAVSRIIEFSKHAVANLIVSDNVGVVGDPTGTGYFEVYGSVGDVTFSNNVLDIATELFVDIRGTSDDTLLITGNQVVAGGDGIYVPAEGFGTVVVEGNNFEAEAPIVLGGTAELTVVDNTFASPDLGVEITGQSTDPVFMLTFSKNVLLTGDNALRALTIASARTVIMEDNQATLFGTAAVPVRALVLEPDGFDMQLTASRNTFTGYGQALFIDNTGGAAAMGLVINNNVLDVPIGASGTAAEIVDVFDTVDARYNQWGTLTDPADVLAAVTFPGGPGTILVDPITLP